MNQWNFIQENGLQTGDRLIRKKGPLSRHHGIYILSDNGPIVAENQAGKGVQYVTLATFLHEGRDNEIYIQRFVGTEDARQTVIPRVNELLGTPYNLLTFNCEHFAELVQNGVAVSRQVGAAAFGVILIGVGALAFGGKK